MVAFSSKNKLLTKLKHKISKSQLNLADIRSPILGGTRGFGASEPRVHSAHDSDALPSQSHIMDPSSIPADGTMASRRLANGSTADRGAPKRPALLTSGGNLRASLSHEETGSLASLRFTNGDGKPIFSFYLVASIRLLQFHLLFFTHELNSLS
ncbi:unnamed protein product [Protopolystoma xenopodis]|uniref:Uncharacterized protein n=1 Tax=Protopolystoma xenopodis TaxID=117903 RepID=A0A448XKJ7_9PLAT|nr:unnamed protein product [Protopolystoma xenopodis]